MIQILRRKTMKKLFSILLLIALVMMASIFLPVAAASAAQSQPFTIPRTEHTIFPQLSGNHGFEFDWGRQGLTTENAGREDLGNVGRHVLVMNVARLQTTGRDQTMNLGWRVTTAHGAELMGDQFLQPRNGPRVLPVIEPFFENGVLVGETAHFYTPYVADFFVVSEFRVTPRHPSGVVFNAFGGAAQSDHDPNHPFLSHRNYMNGHFDFDSHNYDFPYARRISVAESRAGLTAPRYLAGYRVVNGQLRAPDGTTQQPPTHTPTPQPSEYQDIRVVLNGTPLVMDVPPQLVGGRTLLPLRAVAEALGAEVNWDSTNRIVTAIRDGTTIILPLGSTTVTVNGQAVTIDVPATIVGGRTLVPLRFVAESFGIDVNWDGATRTVTITTE